MARKRKPDQSDLVAAAALALADKTGWERLTLAAVAKKARLPESALKARFSDVWDILLLVLKKLEKDTEAKVKSQLGDSWRDNLLEILMTRFELAQKHRGAYASLPEAMRRNPQLLPRFVGTFCRTMEGMLSLAGLKKSACTPVQVAGFSLVYFSAVYAWLDDTTPDLSKTMAVIDRRLAMFEKITQL